MAIIANGQSFSDQQIKDYFASNPNADQVASKAAELGLNQSQLSSAMGTAGYGGNTQAERDAAINGYMGSNSGYQWGGNGILSAAPQQPPPAASGGMSIGGKTYTAQQIKDFYAGGGNERQFLEQNGVTDLWSQRDLTLQARGIAGPGTMAGDAGLQQYFKQYQQYNPTGANANNYQGWLADQNPHSLNAMRAGTYTGASVSPADYGPGGIYGPGSAGYGTPGYASGLGPRGDGGSWDGGAAGGASGGAGTGSAGMGGGTGGSGSAAGGTSSAGGVAPWNVGAEQTVEGRINGILNPNNPIIQQARTRSLQAMNDRGLANSSLAVTAGDAAAYDAAIPIAAADAATFAKASGYNADQINQFTQADLNRQMQMAQAQLSANTQMSVAQLSAETQKYIAGLDGTQKQQAQDLQLKNATLLNTNSQAAQIFNTGMGAITNITNNAQMDADTKTRATANVWHDVQNQLKVLETTSGLNLGAQLSFAGYQGFDDKGNWVGFPDAPPKSSAPAETVSGADASSWGNGRRDQ